MEETQPAKYKKPSYTHRYKYKLAKKVQDICHFGYKHRRGGNLYDIKPYLVVKTIFEVIEKGIKEDGFVTIPNFGRFYVHYGWKLKPYVRFRPCEGLKKELLDDE